MSSLYKASSRKLNSFLNILKETLRFPFKRMSHAQAGAEVGFRRNLMAPWSQKIMRWGLVSKRHFNRYLRGTISTRAIHQWTLYKKRANLSCRRACRLWKKGKMPSGTCFLRMSSRTVTSIAQNSRQSLRNFDNYAYWNYFINIIWVWPPQWKNHHHQSRLFTGPSFIVCNLGTRFGSH